MVNTAQKSISSWTYLDDSGNTLSLSQPRLVRSAGKYWIEHQYNGGTYYFEAELTIHGDQDKVTAQAKSDMRVAKADMGGSTLQPVNYALAVSLTAADYSFTLDGNDELGNSNLKLVHVQVKVLCAFDFCFKVRWQVGFFICSCLGMHSKP